MPWNLLEMVGKLRLPSSHKPGRALWDSSAESLSLLLCCRSVMLGCTVTVTIKGRGSGQMESSVLHFYPFLYQEHEKKNMEFSRVNLGEHESTVY